MSCRYRGFLGLATKTFRCHSTAWISFVQGLVEPPLHQVDRGQVVQAHIQGAGDVGDSGCSRTSRSRRTRADS